MDIGSVQDRLTSIEFGLAALHQSMRTLMEQGAPSPRTRPQEPPVQEKSPPPAYMSAPPEAEPAYRPASSNRPTYTAPPPRETWPEYLPMPPAFEGRDMRYDARSYDRPAPPQRKDAISDVRRPDDKANLLTRPAFGGPDPLEDISGVGPMLHGLLNDIGVYYFWQIAEWGPEEIAWVDSLLDGFNGRIQRDNWVGQAGILASRTDTANRP